MRAGDLPVGERRRHVLRELYAGRRAPEYIKRRGEAERLLGRCGRMRVTSVMGVVVRGKDMLRGRSGMEVAKRITRLRGENEEGEGEDYEAIIFRECSGRVS